MAALMWNTLFVLRAFATEPAAESSILSALSTLPRLDVAEISSSEKPADSGSSWFSGLGSTGMECFFGIFMFSSLHLMADASESRGIPLLTILEIWPGL
ncbi:MAG: hypothetical protein EB078_11645 [Proteobacteria bacterium]|nr:hypothetical protein [Pseudomonadota bacterium]